MSDSDNIYKMTLDLNVLNHLGINLYSNVPAVVAEVVANSWDADAENVDIVIDRDKDCIVITDDGYGMNRDDINDKYLMVGYQRRTKEGESITPKWKRKVMGRKGIGKLSLFSIADIIEIHTVKDGQKNAFRMSLPVVRQTISEGRRDYSPEALHSTNVEIAKGTRIVISTLKKDLAQAAHALRKRLARRFSIIGDEFHFSISIDGSPVTIEDRDYYHKLQYIWRYGDGSEKYAKWSKDLEKDYTRSGKIQDTDYAIYGWIGAVKETGHLQDGEDNLNKIVIMVRGKIAQEDVLEEFGEGGLYAKYLIGEINADFLDLDNKEDITTTSRQKIIEDDTRYQILKTFIYKELKEIQNRWTPLRNEQGVKRAEEVPAIKEWLNELPQELKKKAHALFGKINQVTVESDKDRRQLFKHGVLAFESLRYKDNLDALDRISPENLQALTEIFTGMDDIEATLYHQIVNERVQIIKKLKEKVEEDALEKVIQEHLFKHLWLLDASWERATTPPYMEENVRKEFAKIDAGLTDEEKASRLDIKYTTTSGKHVVVELKRASRVLSTIELIDQISKYREALVKLLQAAGREKEPVEFVCVIGRDLKDWSRHDGRRISANQLKEIDARVVQYTQLIDNAYSQYQDFLKTHEHVGRVSKLIHSIETEE